jgi:diguanylate cyclase (GGDEF)-like protein
MKKTKLSQENLSKMRVSKSTLSPQQKTTRQKKLDVKLSEVKSQGKHRETKAAAVTAAAADLAADVTTTTAAAAANAAAAAAAEAAAAAIHAAVAANTAADAAAEAVAEAAAVAADAAANAAATAAAVVHAAVTAAATAATNAATAAAAAADAAATAAAAVAAASAVNTATAADTAATAAADAATTATSALVESEIQRGRQEELAQTDRLTELGNQSGFFEDLDRQLKILARYNHPAALAVIDIDDFKEVNDTFGHLAGNKLLKSIGLTIRQSIRSSDMAGRIGGDEFAILFPETEPKKAKEVLGKLLAALYRATKDEFPKVTFSVGIAGYKSVPAAYKDMVRAADLLMYEIKKTGKNGTKFKNIN